MRASLDNSLRGVIPVLASLVLLAGCVDTGSGDTDGATDADPENDPYPMTAIEVENVREAEILIVIDNSASMGAVQANLAASIGALTEALDGINYRIAITTTDDGNYWCEGEGEAGHFVASSCRERLADFELDDDDARASCTDVCNVESLDILPTTATNEPTTASRPWLEVIDGVSNLGGGVSIEDALRCAIPQGVSGCGFESPLESMLKALQWSADSEEGEYGFQREHSVLGVLFVTDEADCSANPVHASTLFGEPGVGNQEFWSVHNGGTPTSAACWNAGVDCDFPPEGGECVAVDHEADGDRVWNPEWAADDAVLHPLSRYTALLEAIELAKQDAGMLVDVVVAGVVGVPEGFQEDGRIVYAEGPDGWSPSSFQARYGIGPGCVNETTEAVPPVRLREFTEAASDAEVPPLFSVCGSDYTPALQAFAEAIREELPRSCFRSCAGDADPAQAGFQPECRVEQVFIDVDGQRVVTELPECSDGVIPDGADVCVRFLTGSDLSASCAEDGFNLEFEFFRRPGTYVDGAQFSADCEFSENTEVDCPGLPS